MKEDHSAWAEQSWALTAVVLIGLFSPQRDTESCHLHGGNGVMEKWMEYVWANNDEASHLSLSLLRSVCPRSLSSLSLSFLLDANSLFFFHREAVVCCVLCVVCCVVLSPTVGINSSKH